MMMQTIALRSRGLLAGAALSALVFTGAPAWADTPPDTLVQAWAIDDIISLDPAEAFELSTGEITGNTYDMLVRLDVNDTTKVVGGIAESWTVSDDGLTYTFKLKPGLLFLDEATAALDPDGKTAFHQAIKDNCPDAIVISVMHEAIAPRSATGAEFYHSVLTIADGIATKKPLVPTLPAELTTILANPPVRPIAKAPPQEDGWLRITRMRLRQK